MIFIYPLEQFTQEVSSDSGVRLVSYRCNTTVHLAVNTGIYYHAKEHEILLTLHDVPETLTYGIP